MDKWLFIEVQTYRSVNKMGLELGEYVYDRYNKTVVHKDCMIDIANDIKDKMEELKAKYPRCKEFLFNHERTEFSSDPTADRISVGPKNPFNDNYAFILRTVMVRKMNLETSLNF